MDDIFAYDPNEGIKYDESYDYDAFICDLDEHQSYLHKADKLKKIKISEEEYREYFQIRSKNKII